MSATTTRERRDERAARKAQRALERDYDRLRSDVLAALRGKLVAANARIDDADLEVAYNLAWHALYDKLRAGETIDNPGGFLTQVSFFRAMDDFRSQRPGRRADVDLEVAGGIEPDVDGRLDDQDQLRAFTEGLGQRLDGRERQAAVLCYLHGYTRPEAAELLGLPPARMEKVMDGVSKVVRRLVADLKQGGWCESQQSLMTAYALGVLAPEGQRREMATAHLAGCSGCRAHVRRLRGMGAIAPPFLLPWAAVGLNPLHLPAQILGGLHLVPGAPMAAAPLLAGGHAGAGGGAVGAGGSGAGGSGAGGSGAGGAGGSGAGGSGAGGSGAGASGGSPGNGPKVAAGVAALLLLLGGVALAAGSGSESPTAAGYGESGAGGVLASSPTAAGYGESSALGVLQPASAAGASASSSNPATSTTAAGATGTAGATARACDRTLHGVTGTTEARGALIVHRRTLLTGVTGVTNAVGVRGASGRQACASPGPAGVPLAGGTDDRSASRRDATPTATDALLTETGQAPAAVPAALPTP